MTTQIKNIIQWLVAGAPKAEDGRATLIKNLYKDSSISPYQTKLAWNGPVVVFETELTYTDIVGVSSNGTPKFLPGKKAIVKIQLSGLENNSDHVIFNHNHFNKLIYEELLVIYHLYTVLSNSFKRQKFISLVKENKRL
jgi:hypothetical protein